MDLREDDTSNLFTYVIRFEKQKQSVYYRRYKKIQNLIPEMGGLVKVLLIVGFLISMPYSMMNRDVNFIIIFI